MERDKLTSGTPGPGIAKTLPPGGGSCHSPPASAVANPNTSYGGIVEEGCPRAISPDSEVRDT